MAGCVCSALTPPRLAPRATALSTATGARTACLDTGRSELPRNARKGPLAWHCMMCITCCAGFWKNSSPPSLAVESVFTALNMRTALRLAEVRGVVLLAAEQFGVEVYSYSPREVKACVAGYGQADKRQMQIMVRALLHMKELPEPTDAADALAVALCHLQAEVLERRYGLSRGKNVKTTIPRITVRAAAAIDATPLRSPGIQSNR